MLFAALILAVILITGCEITLTSTSPRTRVTNARYASSHVDHRGRDIICDNRSTTLTYRFNYQGSLDAWTSWLEGRKTGEIRGLATFTPSSPHVIHYAGDAVEVRYRINPGTAPLALDDDLPEPQSIVVVPNPEIIGFTHLKLNIRGDGKSYHYTTRSGIPVVAHCP